MSADPTIPDPTAPISYGQTATGSVLPAGLPEVCGPDGNTWLTVTPCTAENPTKVQACADPAYAPYLDCSDVATVALPTTGTAAVPTAIGGGVALALGLAMLAPLWRRRRHLRA